MSRFLFSAGAVVLLGGAFLFAQVRPQPSPTVPPPQPGQKAVAPEQGLAPAQRANSDRKAAADKQAARRRSRSRVYLGVYTVPVEDMSNRSRRKLKLDNTDGVIVVEVMPDSPADDAGLRHGDVITHVNGKLVDDEDELIKDLNQVGPDKPIKLTVIRDGKKREMTAELDEMPAGEHGAFADNQEAEEMMGMCHENAQRIERLERKIARLEKRLADMEKPRSTPTSP
jgi:membrane-associated protease RseP (regulator of RpoE activity)